MAVGRGWAVGASGDVESPGGLRLDLLMVRDRSTGRFVYTERLERRSGETSWEYVRRSVRREARIRKRFDGDTMEVIVGWDVDSVEAFCARTRVPYGRRLRRSFGKKGSRGANGRRCFLYATLITIVVIFAAITVSSAAERAKKAEEERRG